MNKVQFIEKISGDANISKIASARVLDAFIEAISKTLRTGDHVGLVGFGTFSVRSRSDRVGRNPQTGETIKIEKRKVPIFKAGKVFRDSCN
ncbi:HU family DNA-binding protein [Candidatus Photodesmus blepharus]|uniref:HU family DNA-binding protein n=1 Tax=Candidatus Photodesmus blepharonis TaxID=1179155 RepID=UPI0005513D37|nr:HU family DNA-binding protein [Candidatus Photodesmus blepharus]